MYSEKGAEKSQTHHRNVYGRGTEQYRAIAVFLTLFGNGQEEHDDRFCKGLVVTWKELLRQKRTQGISAYETDVQWVIISLYELVFV